mgnify:CR=1 FL=1
MSVGGGLVPSATSPTIGTVHRTLTFIPVDASFEPSLEPPSVAQPCAQTATSKESSALGFNSAILHLDAVAAHARLSAALAAQQHGPAMRRPRGSTLPSPPREARPQAVRG